MEPSILKSTKKMLNLSEDDHSFDLDILTQINSSLAVANQIGVGNVVYYVPDEEKVWADLQLPIDQLNLLKTYVFLKVKAYFDPDSTSFTQEARKQQIEELEGRLYIAADALRHPLPEEVA